MLRKKLFNGIAAHTFRDRSGEPFRIEALSDAVFAFSVSFLVASLEVPQTFRELRWIVNGALPFFATISIVFLLWYQQYIFFRHYGVNNRNVIVVNLAYLGVILFYVYPLKFLFSLLITSWTGIDLFPHATENKEAVLLPQEFPQLIILFSIGYFFIWFLLYLMHQLIKPHQVKPELNRYEMAYTRKEKRGALLNCLVAILSILFIAFGTPGLSGMCYLLIPLVLGINQVLFKRELARP